MLQIEKVIVIVPKLWKKSFINGIIIPVKVRRCDERKFGILCMTCNNQVSQNKEFEDILNLIKREPPNQFGHMLPHYIVYFYCEFLVLVHLFYGLFFFFVHVTYFSSISQGCNFNLRSIE